MRSGDAPHHESSQIHHSVTLNRNSKNAQRNPGTWGQRLRKRNQQIAKALGRGHLGPRDGRRLLGFELLEERHLLAVQPFPVPLDPVQPLSSLVYRGTASAGIDVAGESESFTIDLDGNQQLTLVAEPDATLTPTLEILDPSFAPLATTVATASGERAALQSVPILAPGTYTINVTGDGVSVGNFSLTLYLNAALETDRIGGAANSTPAEAQSLDGGFITFGARPVQRSAVVGPGSASGPLFAASLTHTNDVFTGNVLAYDFGGAPAPIGDATLTLSATADLDSSSEFLTVSAEGIFSQNVFVSGGLQQQPVTTTLTIPQFTLQQLAADGTVSFTVTPSASVGNLGNNSLTLDLSYPVGGGTGELGGWYEFSLADGQSTSIVLDSAAGTGLQLELYDADGTTLLTTGVADSQGRLRVEDFTDSTSDLLPATYFIRVASAAEYALVVTRDATFESGSNTDLAPNAQDVTHVGAVFGRIGAGSLGGSTGVTKVGVLSSIDFEVANQLKLAGMDASVITAGQVTAGELVTQGFDVVVVGRDYLDNSVSQPFVDAITSFVEMGGGIVTEWDGVSILFDGFHPTYRYNPLLPQSDLLSGQVGGGNDVNFATPITKVANHPIWAGLPDQFSAGGGTEYFYTIYNYDPLQIDVIATFQGNGTVEFPSQSFPAVFVGREFNIVGIPFDWQDAPTDPNLVTLYTNAVRFADAGGSSSDYYSVEAQAGDTLIVQTTVPAAGSGEFENLLDVAVELYDPLGNLVASDASGTLSHTASLSGAYTVRVLSEGDTRGEYVLEVFGQSGGLPPFEVSATDPANGAELLTVPTEIVVDLSDEVLLTSVDAGDLTLNSLPATGVTVVHANTLRFTLPATAEGMNTVAIAGGALVDLQGQPLAPFTSQFQLDSTAPRVISSSIHEGDTAAGGTLIYTAEFDDELNAASLDASDVLLVGQLSGSHSPASFQYDSLTSTLTLQYEGLPEDQFTLTLLSGSGRFEDSLGRALDGERDSTTTVPSGDGTPGGNFVVDFVTDFGIAPYPTPLTPVAPSGSLIYDPSISGVIGAGDSDSFTLQLDDGQTLSVVVTADAALQAEVLLFGPGDTPIGSAAAAVAGQEVVLQTVPTSGNGTYRVSLRGIGGTTDTYSLRIVLNSALEAESHGGAANDSIATAQDLDGSFTDLGVAGAERGAVLGNSAIGTTDFYRFSLAANQSATLALTGLSASGAKLELHDAAGRLLARGLAAANVTQLINSFVATTGGVYYVSVTDGGGEYSLLVTRNADFDREPNDGLGTSAQDITLPGTVLGGVITGVASPTGTGVPIAGPIDVLGSPLSLGIAVDGSFVGNSLGAVHNGVEYLRYGTYLATYSVAFNGGIYTNGSPSHSTAFPVALEDLSSGPRHMIRAKGNVVPGVGFERVVAWSEGDDFAVVYTRLTNDSRGAPQQPGAAGKSGPRPGRIVHYKQRRDRRWRAGRRLQRQRCDGAGESRPARDGVGRRILYR